MERDAPQLPMTAAPIVLPPRLAALEPGLAALLLTVGSDGSPHAAFTWVAMAPFAWAGSAPPELRIAVDSPSTRLENLHTHARGGLQIIGPDSLLFLVKGTARVTGVHDIPPHLRWPWSK